MDQARQRIAPLIILTFVALMLFACGAVMSTTQPEFSPTPGNATPVPGMIGSLDPASANAQATIEAGQSQLLDLSLKATEVSLNMSQAANAAAQSTLEYNQRQQLLLDHQATVISLNIARAAATQKAIRQQTKIAREATTAAQNSAFAATRSVYLMNATRTAIAQGILDAYVAQTAQVVAASTMYSLTATPFAVTQAALLMQQYDREQKSFVDRIVSPSIPIVATILFLLVLILVIGLVYRRFMPSLWLRRMRIGRVNADPLIMIDGVISEHELQLHQIIPSELSPANPPGLPYEKPVHVEIIDASEPPVAYWIAEVEAQMANEGRPQL